MLTRASLFIPLNPHPPPPFFFRPGDETPATKSGKTIAAFAMLSGILIIALPVSVLGTNFSVAYQKAVDVKAEKADRQHRLHELRIQRRLQRQTSKHITPKHGLTGKHSKSTPVIGGRSGSPEGAGESKERSPSPLPSPQFGKAGESKTHLSQHPFAKEGSNLSSHPFAKMRHLKKGSFAKALKGVAASAPFRPIQGQGTGQSVRGGGQSTGGPGGSLGSFDDDTFLQIATFYRRVANGETGEDLRRNARQGEFVQPCYSSNVCGAAVYSRSCLWSNNEEGDAVLRMNWSRLPASRSLPACRVKPTLKTVYATTTRNARLLPATPPHIEPKLNGIHLFIVLSTLSSFLPFSLTRTSLLLLFLFYVPSWHRCCDDGAFYGRKDEQGRRRSQANAAGK